MTFTPTAFILMLATSGHLAYAAWMVLPQTANTLFTLLLWWRLEPVQYRSWSWLLVLLQCWPQVGPPGQTALSTISGVCCQDYLDDPDWPRRLADAQEDT